jgi:DNA-directed RNA polymerase subunit beta
MVDDKMHARSIGPYSLITQQPLVVKHNLVVSVLVRWKFGHLKHLVHLNILQEILTVKSDDVNGRAKAYESIVKGENMPTRYSGIIQCIASRTKRIGLSVNLINEIITYLLIN